MCSSLALGPPGLRSAFCWLHQGRHVLLVDRATFSRDKAYAAYLSPACTPLLVQLGVPDATLTATPQRLQGMRVMDHHSRACRGRVIQDGECLYVLALPWLVLDHLL